MDLKAYDFKYGLADLTKDNELLKEADKRGFYNGNTKYNQLFSDLFFMGGTLNFKEDLDEAFKAKVLPYLKELMRSFAPAYEDKEAVCAMLLSELVDA